MFDQDSIPDFLFVQRIFGTIWCLKSSDFRSEKCIQFQLSGRNLSDKTGRYLPGCCPGRQNCWTEKIIGLGPSVLKMSALFHFQSLVTVILLLICTCTYVRSLWPSLLDQRKTGILSGFWKCARIGERLSPYVALSCILLAFQNLFFNWLTIVFPLPSKEFQPPWW